MRERSCFITPTPTIVALCLYYILSFTLRLFISVFYFPCCRGIRGGGLWFLFNWLHLGFVFGWNFLESWDFLEINKNKLLQIYISIILWLKEINNIKHVFKHAFKKSNKLEEHGHPHMFKDGKYRHMYLIFTFKIMFTCSVWVSHPTL